MEPNSQSFRQPWQQYLEEVQKYSLEAYEQYRRAMYRTWVPEDIRKHLEEAHRDYVRMVQEAFAQTPLAAVDILTLAAMSQSLMAALMTATCGIGPGDVSDTVES